MSYNGSGVFVINSTGEPAVANTLITAATHNALTADLATGLSTTITKDGQTTPTANIPLGGFKLTGVGAATARTDAASLASIQDGTGTYVATVGGTADAITLTASPAITAYVAGQTFRWIASGANTTAVTVAISGLAAKAITKNGTTALVAGDIASGAMVQATYDGTRFILGVINTNTAVLPLAGGNLTGGVNSARGNITQHATTMDFFATASPDILDGTGSAVTITACVNAPQAGATRKFYPIVATVLTHGATFDIAGNANLTAAAGDCWIIEAKTVSTYRVTAVKEDGTAVVSSTPAQIQPISASVAASALTISASALTLDFRSATLTSGTVTSISGTPANLVISSGSTLGTVNAVQSRITVLALNNAGTIELAAVNTSGGLKIDETGVISTTAEGGAGAADSALVAYSTTARTNVAYRVIGFIESTQATAGTWATAPSTIQGAGGQAAVSTAMNAQGAAPMFACRAWANFNGDTPAIRASGNISSLTRNATGNYTLNFTTNFIDADYAYSIVGSVITNYSGINTINADAVGGTVSPTTSSCRFDLKRYDANAAANPTWVNFIAIR